MVKKKSSINIADNSMLNFPQKEQNSRICVIKWQNKKLLYKKNLCVILERKIIYKFIQKVYCSKTTSMI